MTRWSAPAVPPAVLFPPTTPGISVKRVVLVGHEWFCPQGTSAAVVARGVSERGTVSVAVTTSNTHLQPVSPIHRTLWIFVDAS